MSFFFGGGSSRRKSAEPAGKVQSGKVRNEVPSKKASSKKATSKAPAKAVVLDSDYDSDSEGPPLGDAPLESFGNKGAAVLEEDSEGRPARGLGNKKAPARKKGAGGRKQAKYKPAHAMPRRLQEDISRAAVRVDRSEVEELDQQVQRMLDANLDGALKEAAAAGGLGSSRAPAPALNLMPGQAQMAFQAAVKNGDAVPWGRAKLMLVGQGRAGKTSTVRSLLGMPFVNTKSTVGVDLKMTKSVDWVERDVLESDFNIQSSRAAAQRLRDERDGKTQTKSPCGSAKPACASSTKPTKPTKPSSARSRLGRLSARLSKSRTAAPAAEAMPAHPPSVAEAEAESSGDEVEETKAGAPPSYGQGGYGAPPQQQQQAYGAPQQQYGYGAPPQQYGYGAPQAPAEPVKPLLKDDEVARRFDMQLVAREMQQGDGKAGQELAFSIWDYGGQEVFYTLHHIFLTRFGVYMICFDMSEALDPSKEKEVLRYLRFWLNSIQLHAPDSPFLLVGTFMDKVPGAKQHKKIDAMLRKHLNLVRYASLVPNEDKDIGFFPVDNSHGGTEHIAPLRAALEGSVRDAEYVKQPVSLRWMKVLDDLLELEDAHASLDEVIKLSETVGVEADEVEPMLAYFHELGVLVHLTATETLRETVVTKPQWLLDMLSRVICDQNEEGHARSAYDRGLRQAKLLADHDDLRQEGIASRELLEFLWDGEPVDFLLDLMRSMMLISDWKFGETQRKARFLVPSLVPDKPVQDEVRGPTCFLDFTKFYLPTGVFQRLLALVAEHSSGFEDSAEPILRQKCAVLSFGFTDFRLDVLDAQDRIQITIDGESGEVPRTIKVLVSMIRKLKDDVMGKRLAWTLALAATPGGAGASGPCVQYEDAIKAWAAKKDKVRGMAREKVRVRDLRPFFENAEEQGNLLEDKLGPREPTDAATAVESKPLPSGSSFHVFLSHKQSNASDAVNTLRFQLQQRGFRCWFDQSAEDVTKESMRQGILSSAVYLLFLTKDVFTSDYVKFELQTALVNEKPVILMHEPDTDKAHAYARFSEYIKTCPSFAPSLFENTRSIPYRRYRYEADAMMNELEGRLGAMTTLSRKKRHA